MESPIPPIHLIVMIFRFLTMSDLYFSCTAIHFIDSAQ